MSDKARKQRNQVASYMASLLKRGALKTVRYGYRTPYCEISREEVLAGRLNEDTVDMLVSTLKPQDSKGDPASTGAGGQDPAAQADLQDADYAEVDMDAEDAACADSFADAEGEEALEILDHIASSKRPKRQYLRVVISPVSVGREGLPGYDGLVNIKAQIDITRDDENSAPAGPTDGYGRIKVEVEENNPWMPLNRLATEHGEPQSVMLGRLSDYWRFWNQNAQSQADPKGEPRPTAAQAIELGDRLYSFVNAGVLPPDEKPSDQPATVEEQAKAAGLELITDRCLVRQYVDFDPSEPIIGLYNAIGASSHDLPLYDRAASFQFGSGYDDVNFTQLDGEGAFLRCALESCGTMSRDIPLAESQRRAVHAFVEQQDGEILAVSGPPGTGKTTMLQAVVASQMVKNALAGEPAPLIVGTSTNNQAVTNMIGSFGNVSDGVGGSFFSRWLPRAVRGDDGYVVEASPSGQAVPLQGIAVYCPAVSRADKAREDGYLVETRFRNGVYGVYSGAPYAIQAARSLQGDAYRYFPGKPEVSCIDERDHLIQLLEHMGEVLHAQLQDLDDLRCASLRAIARFLDKGDSLRALGQLAPIFEWCNRLVLPDQVDQLGAFGTDLDREHFKTLDPWQQLAVLDGELDTSARFVEFWLAVHYYETRWLVACLKDEIIQEDERFKTTLAYNDTYWAQTASFAPCYVMTEYQLPRYFREYRGKASNPDFGRIDLLITDESGQVDTPLALASLSLAKKAVFVGDEDQLPPIWHYGEDEDKAVAMDSGFAPLDWGPLQKTGLTGSYPSSAMKAAAHACKWRHDAGKPGLFLSEHYRCDGDIIAFCNELVYDGKLKPCRSLALNRMRKHCPDGVFLFCEVPDSEDSLRGSSRVNQAEAMAIADWLERNGGRLKEIYGRDSLSEIVGIVTPFNAQARLIYQELSGRGIDLREDGCRTNITVGTAHRLQGAEAPVILFSLVYGDNSEQAGFVESNPNLMNVAVSRAKDLLIVFGSPRRRKDNGEVVSTLMRHAKESTCDLVDGVLPNPKEDVSMQKPQEDPQSYKTISAVLRELREEYGHDMPTSPQMNKLLEEAGLIKKIPEPTWFVTQEGIEAGLRQRPIHKGDEYSCPEYSEEAYEVIRKIIESVVSGE